MSGTSRRRLNKLHCSADSLAGLTKYNKLFYKLVSKVEVGRIIPVISLFFILFTLKMLGKTAACFGNKVFWQENDHVAALMLCFRIDGLFILCHQHCQML